MFLIICAEMEEVKHIKCDKAKFLITGVGFKNVINSPIIKINKHDLVLNIGYAGSSKYKQGEVISVDNVKHYSKNFQQKEIKPISLLSDICYTSDVFIQNAEKEIPLVDMELYYLRLIYPQIQSLKIISDNLSYNEYKQANFEKSWELVNKFLNKVSNYYG